MQYDWIFDENSDDEPPPPLPEHERPSAADHTSMATSFTDMQDLLRLASRTDEGTFFSSPFHPFFLLSFYFSLLPSPSLILTRINRFSLI